MDTKGEALHPQRTLGVKHGARASGGWRWSALVLRARATSRGECSLRSAGGHVDGMDRVDGMDTKGEALHASSEIRVGVNTASASGAAGR